MKKTLSYIWPLTKKIKSDYSGDLEVTWLNGKKILDTKNANYSYGALHEILDIALEKTNADRSGQVLVLGLGGGSILQLLREKYNFYGKITAVEIDKAIIKVANSEFNIQQYAPIEVICEDALQFVQQHSHKYETVIVDIFIDIKVPEAFFQLVFWQNLSKLLSTNATVIFNAGIGQQHIKEIENLLQQTKKIFLFKKIEHVKGTNTILLGQKI